MHEYAMICMHRIYDAVSYYCCCCYCASSTTCAKGCGLLSQIHTCLYQCDAPAEWKSTLSSMDNTTLVYLVSGRGTSYEVLLFVVHYTILRIIYESINQVRMCVLLCATHAYRVYRHTYQVQQYSPECIPYTTVFADRQRQKRLLAKTIV